MTAVTYFQIYEDADARWRWRFRSSATHELLGRSTKGYVTEAECREAIKTLKRSGDSPIRALTDEQIALLGAESSQLDLR